MPVFRKKPREPEKADIAKTFTKQPKRWRTMLSYLRGLHTKHFGLHAKKVVNVEVNKYYFGHLPEDVRMIGKFHYHDTNGNVTTVKAELPRKWQKGDLFQTIHYLEQKIEAPSLLDMVQNNFIEQVKWPNPSRPKPSKS